MTDSVFLLKRIAAGIITYNPDPVRLEENIKAISPQCERLYVVDNGSRNRTEIETVINLIPEDSVTLICNRENQGIAKALNQLCSNAWEDGYKWIVTLDQDSVSPPDLVENYGKCMDDPSIGMLCPRIIDRNRERKDQKKSGEICEVNECITSGSMILLSAWKKLSGFDELMFIDGVDFDMCHRLRNAGYKIIRNENIELYHELGHIRETAFLIWKVSVKNHSAFRKYYIARNTIYLAKKEHRSLLRAFLQNIKLALISMLYEEEKIKKIIEIVKGTFEGIKLKNIEKRPQKIGEE